MGIEEYRQKQERIRNMQDVAVERAYVDIQGRQIRPLTQLGILSVIQSVESVVPIGRRHGTSIDEWLKVVMVELESDTLCGRLPDEQFAGFSSPLILSTLRHRGDVEIGPENFTTYPYVSVITDRGMGRLESLDQVAARLQQI